MSQSKSQTRKPLFTTQEITTISVLAAIAAILFFWPEITPIPVVPFYKLDFSNLPVLLGTFSMGPMAGTVILFVKSLLGLLHSNSQGVGELADFLIGLAMVLPTGLIYRGKKSRNGAIAGMAVGSLVAMFAAVLFNVYLLIPFFAAMYHMPIETIIGMGQKLIPSLDTLWKFVFYITAPFNLLKWVVISILGTLIYKPLSPILHSGFRVGKSSSTR